jgi:exosortase/archaeosortase family protein
MKTRLAPVLLRLGVVIGIISIGYVLLRTPTRDFEATVAASLLKLSGTSRLLHFTTGSILVEPTHHEAFVAVVTPSCSSIASVLALTCLAAFTRTESRTRLIGALAAAIVVVVTGNILRIAASLGVGLIAGRESLVLFHDLIGSVFTFVYILGGYVLMLYFLLPKHSDVAIGAQHA